MLALSNPSELACQCFPYAGEQKIASFEKRCEGHVRKDNRGARQHEVNVQIRASRESGKPSRLMNVASMASTYTASIRFSGEK